MPDREKVVFALELHRSGKCQDTNEQLCPYWGHDDDCFRRMADDILSLMKEQETVEHAKEVLCKNGWEKMRFPDGTIGRWDDPEVVRCKDCDNKECWGRAGDVVCGIDGTPHRPDWFCADGKRRNDDG